MQFSEIEEKTAELLAVIYSHVDWMNVARSHNAWDIFQHRVRTAATQPDVERFIERLCYAFGIQSIAPDYIELVSYLNEHNDDVMDVLREKSIVVCMLAIRRVREERKKRKSQKENKNQLFKEVNNE